MLFQISHRSGNGDVRSVVATHGINGYCDIHQAILLRFVQLGFWIHGCVCTLLCGAYPLPQDVISRLLF